MGTILIVTDDQLINTTLGELLDRMGHSVIFAHTLKNGLERAIAEQCDVILLNVRMPDGNGLSALTNFKEVPYNPEVVVITDHGNSIFFRTLNCAGIGFINNQDDYFPFYIPLFNAINNALEIGASS